MCISHIQRPFNLLIPSQVVYFGDSMHSDIFPAHHYSNWETVFILEELLGDKVMVPAETESEPLEKKGKYEVSVPLRYFLKQKRASYRKASCTEHEAAYLTRLLAASLIDMLLATILYQLSILWVPQSLHYPEITHTSPKKICTYAPLFIKQSSI